MLFHSISVWVGQQMDSVQLWPIIYTIFDAVQISSVNIPETVHFLWQLTILQWGCSLSCHWGLVSCTDLCRSIQLLIQLGPVHSKQILKVTCQGNVRVRNSSMVWRAGLTIIKTTVLDLSNGTYVNHLHTWKRERSRLWMGRYLEGKHYLTFPDPPLKQNKEPAQIRLE